MSPNSGRKSGHFMRSVALRLARVRGVNIPLLRSPRWPAAWPAVWPAVWLAWLLCALPAAAQVPSDALARALDLARQAATALAPRQARVQVQAGALDARLTLAPCAQIDAYLPAGAPAFGHTRVGLRCTAGAARWNVFLPVTVQVWAPGLVATDALPAGARLSEGQLRLAEVDWASAASEAFADPQALAGRMLARPVAAGQPLRAADLQARQWFARGDTVRIVLSGAGVSVIAEGQALTPGIEGKPARVSTEGGRAPGGGVTENSRVLTGLPVGERRMEIAL